MSTPPRPRPPSKRMRLDTTRVDSRKSRSTCALAPQAKRFRFSDSSSSSSSNYPLPLYGSSPDRMSFEVLAPGMVGNSQLSTCSVALQRLCVHPPKESSTVSPSAVTLPSSSPVSPPQSSPSPCASGIYSPSFSRSPSRTPSPFGVSP